MIHVSVVIKHYVQAGGSSCCPSPHLHLLTSLFDFQYQVVSLQGGVGLDVDSLDGPAHRGVDHRLHLHG